MSEKKLYKVGSSVLIIFISLVLSYVPVIAGSTKQTQSWVDRDRFPEAYSILTSDRVMFPDDISNWPLKIDSTHQLFVDDYLISKIEHLTRQFHQPKKYPKNPLMGGGYLGVLYDEDKGLFRMWNGRRYFTSSDGVNWEQPDLGTSGNLLFKDGSDLRGFMYNPDLPESQGRYKAVVERRTNEKANEPGGFYLYHSRDGINWKQNPERPILQRSTNCMFPCEFRPSGVGGPKKFQWTNPDHFQAYGVGDTSTFRYDTVLKRYIFDGKFNIVMPPEKIKQLGIITGKKPRLKLRTFSESEDLIHFSPPRFMMYPDRLDPPDRQIYTHCGFVYESMWFGIIQAMRFQTTGWKQTELYLSYSRDGRHWLRPQQRQPFIPLGSGDSWDSDYAGAPYTAPVRVGEELFFYYTCSRHPDRDHPNGRWAQYVGLAKLRNDGFASLDAGDTPGQVLTRPITFKGKTLFVNADVGKNGWVKAAVLTRDSKAVGSYGLDDSIALTKDTTKGSMRWKSKNQLVSPGDGHLRLVFQLKNAKLYSFWIE